MKRREQGFSLLEVAIVLVLAGLLLGGVLKGQELIGAARVKSLIEQQDNIRAAYHGFMDRFRALPGDYSLATQFIRNVSTTHCNGGNGDGDGLIETENNENTLVWEHLARAGFISGMFTCAPAAGPATSPMNFHGSPLQLVYDAGYAGTNPTARHNLKTGAQISSKLLAEMDRKIDDGNARDGVFRAQTGGAVGEAATCYEDAGAWANLVPGTNCGGAYLL
jgi:prepilin-type N-terminal cleavage/methylation domain-containing protein